MTDPVTPKPTGTALLISGDTNAIDQIIRPLQQFAISVKVCSDVQEAITLIEKRKFEAVIVDFQLGFHAVSLLQQVHDSPSNRTAVTFAITTNREEAALALQKGSHFLLERPLTADSLNNTVRAAYGSILRERRRYFRYPIAVPVLLRRSGNPQVPGQMMNISERGMALKLPVPVAPGSEGTVQFVLPDLNTPITAEAKVCWSNDQGHAGLQFLSLSGDTGNKLSAWLAQRLEEQLPKNVTQKFGSPTDL
jgi:ActR/RegA family two-component response regulator